MIIFFILYILCILKSNIIKPDAEPSVRQGDPATQAEDRVVLSAPSDWGSPRPRDRG